MPQSDVTPTKSNLLSIQDSLERAQEGYDLLEQKRQVLVMQLMNQVEAARRVKQEVEEAMEEAYRELREARLAHGTEYVRRQAGAVRMEHRIDIRLQSVMGINVPDISAECAPFSLQYALGAKGSRCDAVMKKFHDAVHSIVELAEVENTVFRLARELKKTQRRVNALENTFIPQYKEALEYIEDSLEERDREELVIMKKVKQRRQADKRT
jgi:V/A-type H+-transporting ATPase subunit D